MVKRSFGAVAVTMALALYALPQAQAARTADAIEWKRITLPFDVAGALIEPVWMYNPVTRTTFVGANTKGLFETKDAGDSWTRVDDGSFVTSSVNTDVHTLEIGADGAWYSVDIASGVYRSVNGGRHWTKAFPVHGFKGRVWVDAQRADNIYVLFE